MSIILAISVAITWAQYSAKQMPPGDLDISNSPQFVVISFDDNNISTNIQFLIDSLSSYSNPNGTSQNETHDGQMIPAVWYNISNSFASKYNWDIMRAAKEIGHEIANHTENHNAGLNAFMFSTEQWRSTITKAHKMHTAPYPFEGMGIPEEDFNGFRAPRLEINDSLFQVLSELGYLYDTSLEDGYQDSIDGTNFSWPFKLKDGGGEGWDHKIAMSLLDALPTNDLEELKSYPNLWEIPLSPLIMTDSLSALFGLRKTWHKVETNKITGFDWNVWDGGFNTNDFGVILKTTLDKRLEGNRAPFMVGLHSDNYFAYGDKNNGVFEFIEYALSKPDVRFVTAQELIAWIEQPVGLDGEGIENRIGINALKSTAFQMTIQDQTLYMSYKTQKQQTLAIYNSQGHLIHEIQVPAQSQFVNLPPISNMGIYYIKFNQQSINHFVM